MNPELANNILTLIEICAPILGALTLLYFRLSSKIDNTDAKIDKKFEDLRKEMREDRKEIDQKLDRIIELFIIQNQRPYSGSFIPNNQKEHGT